LENWRFSDRQLIVRYSLILLLVFTGNMFAQSGGSAGSFMSLANGARAFGMGGVTIASSEDATTVFSNPGMVGMLYDGQFNATIAKLAFDRNYYDLAFVYPLNSWGNIGLGWTQLSIDNIQGRDQYGYITQKFSDLQSAFMLGYSKMIGDNFSIGLSGKYLYHSLAGYSAKGVSFDIGSAVYIGEKITLGAVFRNLNSSLKWNTSSKLKETLPTRIGVGFSYFDLFNLPNLIAAADVHLSGRDFLGYNTGAEYMFRDLIIIRGGYSDRGISYGGGIQFGGFKFDVAMTPENFGNSSRVFFTLNWSFGSGTAEEVYEEEIPPVMTPQPSQPTPAQTPVSSTATRNIVLILEGPLANERAEVIGQNPNDNTITVRLLALPGSDPITLGLNQVRFLE